MQSSVGYQEIRLERESINTTAFLNELLDDYELSVSSEVEILRNIENTGLLMETDKFHLSTAIINILNNGIKYGGTKLTVSYSVDMSKGCHIIAIGDNGIGISEDNKHKVFEPVHPSREPGMSPDLHNCCTFSRYLIQSGGRRILPNVP